MTQATQTISPTLVVLPWHDAIIDARGYDPRSPYVERFWLAVLGPSAVWLLRRLARGLESHPEGFRIDVAETARALGLGPGVGRQAGFGRTLQRCCTFGLVRQVEAELVTVRRRVPPLTRRQLRRLPASLQHAHTEWQEAELRLRNDATADRAHRLALTLVELGEDQEAVALQLERWRMIPAIAEEAARWAWEHHRSPVSVDRANEGEGPSAVVAGSGRLAEP